MATREIRLDLTKPLSAQPDRGHNRWHPDIRPVLHVQPGDEVVFDTLDAVDAQLDLARGAEQLAGVSLNRVHPLTGPIAVEGAEPGDVLVVDVLECVAGGDGDVFAVVDPVGVDREAGRGEERPSLGCRHRGAPLEPQPAHPAVGGLALA